MLNTVGTPSSRRTPIACFIALCSPGAKRNPIPASRMHLSTTSGVASMLTPSSCSTSALPQWLVALRLPCLATGTPAPAATSAAQVEMLNVPLPVPPVPQVSTTSSPSTRIGVAASRMAFAQPAISGTVSPLTCSATRNPAICAGVA